MTDEMLRNPPPGDWLMVRRNYQAWSHSPLTEITSGNVKELRLAWVWAMNEGGANQPTPLVHDGIMYLANTMNTVQALDAATGELIWENQVGPTHGDRLRVDAQHRDLRRQGDHRDHRRAARRARRAHRQGGVDDRRSPIAAKGFYTTSGPIVVRGKVIQGLQGCDRYQRGPLLHQRLRRQRPASCCGSSTPSRAPASRAATPGASCPT